MKRVKQLHIKLTILYTGFTVLMGLFLIVFGYTVMRNLAVDFYSEKAQHVTALAADYVNGDDIDRYMTTMETDADYEKLQRVMDNIKEKQEVTYLYIFAPDSDSFTYIMEAKSSADPEEYEYSVLGEVYDYSEIEYTYLVPDVEAKRASEETIISTIYLYGSGVSAWAPVLDSRGELIAMVEADISLDHVMESIQRSMLLMVCVYGLLIIGMILFQSISIRRMITTPLKKLTDRTLKFAAEGQLTDVRDDINTGDELQTLSEAFGQMAHDITTYTDEKAELAAVQERISTELGVAADLRRSMLPDTLPDFPGKRYINLQGELKMCQRIGGDFYDYFMLDNHRVGIVLCSMQSSGIPAAMLLVVVRTIIKSQFSIDRNLAETMSEINRQVYHTVEGKRPIAAFLGVFDTDNGVFSYINASHNPPVVMRQGERYEFLAGQAYAPLGLTENVSYRELTTELRQRDRLMLYSDGVIEAKNPAGESYGAERLRVRLNELRNKDLQTGAMMQGVLDAVETFMGTEQAEDDMVLLTLEYMRGSRDHASLVLPPDIARVQLLQEFLKEQMAVNRITGKAYAQILVCAEELFTICCKYAAGERIEVECTVPVPDKLVLRFTCRLSGNPLSEDAPSVVKHAAAFIRKNSESLETDSAGGQTALVMTRALNR